MILTEGGFLGNRIIYDMGSCMTKECFDHEKYNDNLSSTAF